jgi:hypothetical protein|tara:strand:- start:2918 stop:3397 length:480 start_codon:yes stop_codon:yes gene_type:complete
MKYRRLTLDELKPLENEFIDFLVINGVVASDWEHLLAHDIEKSNQILDAFGEVVFENIMRKTQFLEFRSVGELIAFSCTADLIYMAGIRLDAHGVFKIDFNDAHSIKELLGQSIDGVKIFMDQKKYKKNREKEIFDMIEKGCLISDGKLFKAIATAAVD